MKYTASALAMAGLAVTVHGHGMITSPQPRVVGAAMEAACGQQVYYNQEGDNYGNIQGELQVAATQTDYNAAECDIWLCKGYKFKDNTANVQTYTAGQVVPFKFDIRAPHTGVANVSIVETATNKVIGSPLASWSVFASNANSDYGNETSFSITIPSDLGSTCSTAGACVIQHYWNAASIDQTYESCVDFTVGGSGSSSGSSSAAASSSVAATTSAAVATSSIAANTAIVSTSSAAAVSTSSSVASVSTSSYVSSAQASPTSSKCTTTLTLTSSALAVSSTVSATIPLSTGTGSSSSMKPIPSGLTLDDMLAWVDYMYAHDETVYNGTSSGVSKRHVVRKFKA